MLVGAAQANSRLHLERPLVPTVLQVRVGCRRRGMRCPFTQSSLCAIFGGGCSTRIYVDSGRYRGVVKLCRVIRWPAGLLYAPRGDEEASGEPRDGHTAPEDTPRRNRPLI
jgi:hypothetical protein